MFQQLTTVLSGLLKGIFIASYGYVTNIQICYIPFFFGVDRFKLVFTWILNNYDQLQNIYLNKKVDNCSTFESNHSSLECCFSYKFSDRNMKKKNLILLFRKKQSWTAAFQTCQDIGASFPHLTNRHQMDELLAALKLSHEMFPMLFLFIGLKYDSLKVSRSLAQADMLKVTSSAKRLFINTFNFLCFRTHSTGKMEHLCLISCTSSLMMSKQTKRHILSLGSQPDTPLTVQKTIHLVKDQ